MNGKDTARWRRKGRGVNRLYLKIAVAVFALLAALTYVAGSLDPEPRLDPEVAVKITDTKELVGQTVGQVYARLGKADFFEDLFVYDLRHQASQLPADIPGVDFQKHSILRLSFDLKGKVERATVSQEPGSINEPPRLPDPEATRQVQDYFAEKSKNELLQSFGEPNRQTQRLHYRAKPRPDATGRGEAYGGRLIVDVAGDKVNAVHFQE